MARGEFRKSYKNIQPGKPFSAHLTEPCQDFGLFPPAPTRSTNRSTISRTDDRRNSLIPKFLKKEGSQAVIW